jgi:hypothetical protein
MRAVACRIRSPAWGPKLSLIFLKSSRSAKALAERHLVEAETAFRAQGRFGELPLLGFQQEQIRHGAGQRHAAVEDLRGIGAEAQIQTVAVLDGSTQACGQVPFLHQPAADMRMIHLQALLFVLGEHAMLALQLFSQRVQVGHGVVQRQHAHILQQRRQEDLFCQGLVHGVRERAGCGCGQQGAAPVQSIAQAVRFAAPQGLDQGKTQGQGQSGVQSQHHQGLAQIFTLAALGVQRRIGDTQNFRREGRIHAQGLRDLAHPYVRVLCEFNDVRGHPRGRGEVH